MTVAAIDCSGGMIVRDEMGEKHLFLPCEAAIIGKAWYKYVQKKEEWKGVVVRG